jgi:hypothetical protein
MRGTETKTRRKEKWRGGQPERGSPPSFTVCVRFRREMTKEWDRGEEEGKGQLESNQREKTGSLSTS